MRECGICTACCTIARVPELNKSEGIRCVHCVNNGCAIYERRPKSCRKFQCEWLLGEMPEEMRPDITHVMLERLSEKTVLALAEPGWESKSLTDEITRWLTVNYVEKGVAVVAFGLKALLPKGSTREEVMQDVLVNAKRLGAL